MKRALPILAVLAAAACGTGGDAVSIEGAWARTSAPGQTTGAIYFELAVAADDTLIDARVPPSIAGDAQIHDAVMADMDDRGDMAGSDDMDDFDDTPAPGAMTMQELADGLSVAAGETVSFEPGGHHVMLVDLVEPLAVGDEFDLTLRFAEAGDTTVTVVAAESAP